MNLGTARIMHLPFVRMFLESVKAKHDIAGRNMSEVQRLEALSGALKVDVSKVDDDELLGD